MKRFCTTFLALVMVVTSACHSTDSAARRGKRRLSIATGGTGGVYYPCGGAIAKVISEHLPDTEATAEVTAASVDNLKFLRDGKADIAFTLADTLADAIKGREAFGRKTGTRCGRWLSCSSNYTHIVTLTSNRIASLGDLKGKSVSTGSPGQWFGSDRISTARSGGPQSRYRTSAGRVSESHNRSTHSRTGKCRRCSGAAACQPPRFWI